MLSYAAAFQRTNDPKVQAFCVKKLVECSKSTEWGALFLESELSQLPGTVATLLLDPWSEELRLLIGDVGVLPSLCLDPRDRLFVPYTTGSTTPDRKLPRNFRWLVPFCIAVMSTPRYNSYSCPPHPSSHYDNRDENDIATLASPHIGIRHVLTLTEEEPLNEAWFKDHPIKNTYLPIPNFHAPSIEQMDIILNLAQDDANLPLLIHCGGGKGRAGTVAACYLTAYGFRRPRRDQAHPEMSAGEAIAALRSIRPGSIETPQQEQFVSKWCKAIWSRGSVLPDIPSEPAPCPLEIEGVLTETSDLFVLVGLPGAGKTWFSKCLRARNPKVWHRISQDDSGSRDQCELEIGRARGGRVLLDRCNTDSTDRKRWLALASTWAKAPVCVWFDYDPDLCTSRAQRRIGHPTLPPGNRVRSAVSHMRKMFVRPRLDEGFQAIAILRSFAAVQDLVHRLSPPILLFKFPRTPHFLDLGATSADDLVANLPPPSRSSDPHVVVVITEKVDGSNMGFSLSSDSDRQRRRILVQNRSHYVNPATHEQFKKLDAWIDRHREDVLKILDRDEHFPERFVLFGEWMYATHSIPYTRLPDTFLAFDLYDRRDDVWASRQALAALLSGTGISLVPVMFEGQQMPSAEELKDMIQSPSRFYDGRVEGIYIKEEKRDVVMNRGKVVRGDFICGNENWSRRNDHWTKANLRVNGLLRESASTGNS